MWIPAGNTGMEPGKTSFFQALGVPTKIARGTIEITSDLKLVEAGAKVGASEAALLNLLNISPFTYGMTISQVYDNGQTFSSDILDIEEEQLLKTLSAAIQASPFTYGMTISQVYDNGQTFSSDILDIEEEQLLKTLSAAIQNIAAISLATNFPTLPAVMHSLVNGYKKVLAVGVETEYSWPEIEELKDRIANPDAYAAAAPAAAAAPGGGDAPAEKKQEEEEEESDADMGFGLFD